MALCWKCKEKLETEKGITVNLIPWIHCHHFEPEEKPECWCENQPVGGIEFAKKEIKKVFTAELNYCPQCGREL